MKTSSIAVETSRSTSQSDSIVRQTNKRSFPIYSTDSTAPNTGVSVVVTLNIEILKLSYYQTKQEPSSLSVL